MANTTTLRLGTRASLLARTQSGHVAKALENAHPGLRVELIFIKTTGDRMVDQSLADAGGKGLFTKELELALLAGEIDFAVHSFKDVPVTMPLVDQADLVIASVPVREDYRDCFVSRIAKSLNDIPPAARVGTGSLRRRCQILQHRADLQVQPLRGNVDTRLRKLETGEHDAIILALAGLKRLAKYEPAWMTPIDPAILLPAAGQGALALQCRRDDKSTRDLLAALNHADTAEAVAAERAVVLELGGDCHSPIAALARIEGNRLTLDAALGQRDGNPPVRRATASSDRPKSGEAVHAVCQQLLR